MNSSQEFDNFDDNDAIAIIGITGRFPGANNVDKFWENLRDGVESISRFTDEELQTAGVEPTLLNDSNYVKAGSFIEGIELFDAAFFGYTPREAEITDPQHRLFLESAWEALESAGYDSESYKGKIGVYAGVTNSNYLFTNLASNKELIESLDALNIFIGNEKDNLSTQTSYKLNLTGPSINIQNNCSTSLIAVHLACQSLLNGESDIALAGGVSIAKLPQKSGYQYQEGVLHSPDGHCRTFDANAKGTVFGDGLGIVVLKRLDDAIADGDFIHAVIKGSAINNDGSLKVGFTAPSVNGQREVILEALALAGVEADTISYIEAHGTATPLGDPIEIKALTQAFRASTNQKGFCAIGSVKTNIGHLDTAAGVTGLIKTVLALKHQQIPPSLHFEKPNPEIDFANSPFYVNTKLSEWKTNGLPRRAGVSSFGVGGTNAHVILEEPPVIEKSNASRPWQLILLSAKTSTALETATTNLATYLQQHANVNLADVAYTLQLGRRAFDYRRMVICQGLNEAIKLLQNNDQERVFDYHFQPIRCPVIFIFSGKVSNISRELYEVEATYRKHVDNCAEILQPHLGLDIRDLLFSESDKIAAPSLTNAGLFVIEYALAELLMSWGVLPEAMIGEGIGEYLAAAIAGVFSLEDALAIVANKGELQRLKKVKLNPPRIRFISNATGSWITDAQATNPNYWSQNLQQNGRLPDRISQLLEQFEGVFLQVGREQNLSRLTKEDLDINVKQHVLTCLPQNQQSDVSFLLQILGQLWLFGVNINWSGFYSEEHRHRLPLPTYPFERQRYWIDAKKPGQDNNHSSVSLVKKSDIADWFYIPFWKPSLPPVQLDRQELVIEKSCTLVFLDECSLGINLVKQLEKQNQDVITVKLGSSFTILDESKYTIDPKNHHDYDVLFEELIRKNKLPKKILHLWNVTPVIDREVELAQIKAFYSLLFIAQALGRRETTNDFEIIVISNNLQPVTGTEVLCPEKATLLGPVKVISQEYANINCCSIDVIFPQDRSWQEEKLIENLLAELTVDKSEKLIAYRGLNRWVQSFEPVRFEKPKIEKPRLRERGVYLITGGLGGIGLVLAEYLARTVQAKLLLVGRSPLPNKDEWSQWLSTHDETDRISCKIRKVQELEDLGAEVLAIAADVTNTEQMQSAIAQAKQQFGQINGVIHAAGVPGGGAIQRKTPEEAERILAPKVKGTIVIDAILKNIELDFFVLVSSNSSIVAEFGQVDYCAANAFLDAYAHSNAGKQKRFITSINWDTWQEVGMAVNTELPQRLQELRLENLQQGILPDEGVEVFLRILGNTIPQVVISTSDLLDVLKRYNYDNKIPGLDFLETVNSSKLKYPRPELSNDYVAPQNKNEQKLVDIWQEIIGIERIGIYDNFFELGGDSLIGIQLIAILNKQFDSNLSVAKLYECPNISSMANIFNPEESDKKSFEERLNRGQRRRQIKMQTH